MPASLCFPVEPGQAEYLYRRLLTADPHELPVIRQALDGRQTELVERLWAFLENTQASPDQRSVRRVLWLATCQARTKSGWSSASGFITDRLLALGDQEPQ